MSTFLKCLILIWWCYARGKLRSKSNYHRRIWILNMLYVNLLLGTWFKPSCHYRTVILIHPEQKAIYPQNLLKLKFIFMLKYVFVILSFFFIISCSWIGKEHVKESLIIYRNYALLCVAFMKYFNWDVFYVKQFLWYLENCLLNIRIYNCWKRICSATNYEILPFKGWFYK